MSDTSWKAVGCGCCAGVLLLGFLFFLVLAWGTKRLTAEVVAADITEYVRLVERAEIDEEIREDLLDQLERIRARASHGDVGFFSWLGHEESLEDLGLKEYVRVHTARLERARIQRVLEAEDGNVTRAARRLGISRKSLQTKMKEYGLRDS